MTVEVEAPALEITGLEVRYGGVPAVKGSRPDGRTGRGGRAHRSERCRQVIHAPRPHGRHPVLGRAVRLQGNPLGGLAPERVVRRGLSLVPEGRHVFGSLSVDDNLRLGLVGRRSDGGGVGEDLAWVRELFPVLEEFADRPAGLLSGGQQQQLPSLARWSRAPRS